MDDQTAEPAFSAVTESSAHAGMAPRARPLRQWLWTSYLKTTLYPLLLVEVVIVAIYVWTTATAHRENTEALRQISTAELSGIARREARNISERLAGVSRMTRLFSEEVRDFLLDPPAATPEMHAEMASTPEGMLYTVRDTGTGAVYYSGLHPIGPAERNKAAASALLGPTMRHLKESDELVVQLYFTTFDSMNRLYPYYDVPSQFPPGMDVTRENFYFLADAAHNPERKPRWTDAYFDPAGAGWIVSSIAPMYRGDFLEGTVGIDISLNTIIDEVLKLDIPWQGYGVLLDKAGNVIALPPSGEEDWGVSRLAGLDYQTAIRNNSLKPTDFNVHERPDLKSLAALLGEIPNGVGDASLAGPQLVGWAMVPETGWRLLVIVRQDDIFADANRWYAKVSRIGLLMVAGMVGFYLLFFTFLYIRARTESLRLSRPLLRLNDVMRRIAAGDYRHRLEPSWIAELDETGALLVDTGGQMSRKVEALRQSEDALRVARNEAIAANEAKSLFLAQMSHEIRTPLNGVLGMVELARRTVSDPAQQSRLGTAQTSARHLLRIINDILDFSKIEAGRLRLESAPFDLRALLDELMALYSASAHTKGLHLRADLQPDAPLWLLGDATRLQQVLSNLVSNSIKFTPKGEIVVAARARPDAAAGHELAFSVTDTGIGMEENTLATIFTPFSQADDSITRRFGGTGLGLSICNRLVQLMGGSGLTVTSAAGKGSRFEFSLTLPVPQRPVATAAADAMPVTGESVGRLRILVAEDNPVNQLVVNEMLRQAGHEVTLAENGREAVNAYEPGRFDLGLIDIHMPELDGFGVAREIRALEAANGTHLPLIALTASAFQEDRERAAEAGMEALVAKPVDSATLLAAVERGVREAREAAAGS
jgi:signal transduction histidine kinase/ActR/RegA family two-component response regulator